MSLQQLHGRLTVTLLAILMIATSIAPLAMGQYTFVQDTDGSGNWDDPARWLDGASNTTFPDASGATVSITSPAQAGGAVYALTMPDSSGPAGPTTIGSLTIDNSAYNNAANLTLAAHANGSLLVFNSGSAAPAQFNESAGTAANGPGRTNVNPPITLESDLDISAHNIPGLNTGTTFFNRVTGDINRKITLNGNQANIQFNDIGPVPVGEGFLGEYIINGGGLRFIGTGGLYNSKGVTVNSGGQLQLGQNNAVPVPDWRLASGATVKISGTGKSGGNSSDGTLRFQLNGALTSTLHNGVVLESADARITVQNNAASIGVIDGIVSGPGGLTKSGVGVLRLNNFAHTYAGDTTVLATGGTLSLSNVFLNDGADVLLNTGSLLNLNYTGTDSIRSLYIDGVGVTATGTWGRTGHATAQNFTDLITGDGLLNVLELPGLTGDHNEDGVVDAADYVAWRKIPDLFDGDPDGYDDWFEHFGEPGSGGGSGPVPEPATCISLLIAVCLGASCRRRA